MKWQPEQIMLLVLVGTIPFLFTIQAIGVLYLGAPSNELALNFIEKYSLTIIALFAGVKIGQNGKDAE